MRIKNIEKFFERLTEKNVDSLKKHYEKLKEQGKLKNISFNGYLKKLNEFLTIYTLIKLFKNSAIEGFKYYIKDFIGDENE